MPAVLGYGVGSTLGGGGFLGGTQDGLYDGVPSRVARLQWPTTAGVLTDHMRIFLTFSGGLAPLRLFAVRGLTLPAGTMLRVELYLAAGPTYVTLQNQRAVRFPDGSVGAWFLFPSTTPNVDRADLLVFNDVNGVAAIAADQVFEIGEFAAMRCVDTTMQEDWSDEFIDPTESSMTRDSQPASIGRLGYRKVEVNLSAATYSECYSGGLSGGMDLAQLRDAFSGDRRVMAVPRWRDDTGAVVQSLLDTTAVYGTARMGKVQHLGGDYYAASVVFTEAPARS